jgi:hypothetical protein
MIGTLVRVLIGFAVACLVAGLVVVAYVITPADLAKLSGDAFDNRVMDAVALALRAATHTAIFAAPFALIMAAIAEWQALRGPVFYLLAGIAIAVAGFLAQHLSEIQGAHTILNDYAIRAFLTTGFLGGLAYWIVAGRGAGGPEANPAAAKLVKPEHAEPKHEKPVATETKVESKAAKASESKAPVKGAESKA